MFGLQLQPKRFFGVYQVRRVQFGNLRMPSDPRLPAICFDRREEYFFTIVQPFASTVVNFQICRNLWQCLIISTPRYERKDTRFQNPSPHRAWLSLGHLPIGIIGIRRRDHLLLLRMSSQLVSRSAFCRLGPHYATLGLVRQAVCHQGTRPCHSCRRKFQTLHPHRQAA